MAQWWVERNSFFRRPALAHRLPASAILLITRLVWSRHEARALPNQRGAGFPGAQRLWCALGGLAGLLVTLQTVEEHLQPA